MPLLKKPGGFSFNGFIFTHPDGFFIICLDSGSRWSNVSVAGFKSFIFFLKI
jgi:hypothetical protein